MQIEYKAPPQKRKQRLALEDAEGLVPLENIANDGMVTTAEEATTDSSGAPGVFDDPVGQAMVEASEQALADELLSSAESTKLEEKAVELCTTLEDEADFARNLAHLHNLSRGMDPMKSRSLLGTRWVCVSGHPCPGTAI